MLWRRVNAAGVYACLATAAVVCPLLIADSQSPFLPFMAHPLLRPWLHGAFVAFLVCMAALAVGSLATAPPPEERLQTTTLGGTRAQPPEALEAHGPGLRDYRLWLGLALAITTLLFYLMR